MKTIVSAVLVIGFYSVGFSQSLRSVPQKMNVPEIPSELTDPRWKSSEDVVVEDVSVDMLFDKMAEIENTIYNRKEFEAMLPKNMMIDDSVTFF